ncbi:iron ABC transporter ATP-binding protein [Shewanella sp. NFH-SH190041]|uniref:ABC transporter ATP-binding protein n=1 Tax=Shewanella sp. NFH-SH190041 TaxID=2950245 RepID=UPI0021C40443|nr:ABC transporter ATP-binding protein [Shewanella sp. NFH-SH190041]BDM65865.1 iron ABC transporter ATP-binding protein [Shewanella sp. NFH-SH190041]
MLEAKSLTFSVGHKKPLDGVSLALELGQSVALLGTNGAGKSTLLRILLGLLKPSSGEIILDGRPLQQWSRKEVARKIAYVPQQHVPHFPYTVAQIVAQGCLPQQGLLGGLSREQNAQIEKVMMQMDIAHLAERDYTQLSGGERQRTLLARALVQDTPVILLDEPTNGLDYGSQIRLLMLLKQIAEAGRCVLTITHHPDHALQFSHKVIALHQGRIIAQGTPAQTVTPQLLDQLYQIQVKQVEVADCRFFIPENQ